MTPTDLCAFDDLEPGRVVEVPIGRGRTAGVVRVGDSVRVFSSICPHHGGPLARGLVRDALTADCPGAPAIEPDRFVLMCPWHNWEFDLDTGQALFDRSTRMKLYESAVVDGRVVAQVGA
ncbi:MAG TPA: Rieske (2Fe-2S) protein [Gaiellaceae bacterium]